MATKSKPDRKLTKSGIRAESHPFNSISIAMTRCKSIWTLRNIIMKSFKLSLLIKLNNISNSKHSKIKTTQLTSKYPNPKSATQQSKWYPNNHISSDKSWKLQNNTRAKTSLSTNKIPEWTIRFFFFSLIESETT